MQKDVEGELQGAGSDDWMSPGLRKNEDNARKSSVTISSIFKGMWAGVKATTLTYLASLVPAAGNSLIQLSGLLGLIPAVGAAGISVIATLAIGMKGLGKAISASTPQQFNQAIQGMAPAAAQAAQAIRGLKSDLTVSVQQALWQNLGTAIKDVGQQYLPIVKNGLVGVAGGLNKFAQQTAIFLKFPDVAGDFTTVFANIKSALTNLVPAWDAVLSVADDLVTVGSKFLPQLANSIGDAAAKFAEFINNARGTGQLATWIQTGISAFHNLITIVSNVVSVVLQLFSALDSTGGNLLGLLASLTGQLKAFLQSAQGKQLIEALAQALGAIASNVGPLFLTLLKQLTPIVVQLAPLFASLANTVGTLLQGALKIVGPILLAVATYLNQNKSVIIPLTVALGGLWAAWLLFQGLSAIVTAFTVARDALAGLSIAEGIAKVATIGFNAVLDANPIILIGIAIVAVAVLIATHWKQTLAILTGIWNGIKSVATTVWNAISSFFIGLWNGISNAAKAIFEPIASFFTGIWNAVSGAVSAAWNAIKTALVTAWLAIVNATRPIWQPLVAIFQDILTIIKDLFIIIFGGIAIVAIAIWKGIVAVAKAVWQPIATFFTALWTGVEYIFNLVWTGISTAMQIVWGVIVAVAKAVWQPIADFFTALWTGIKTIFSDIWNDIRGPLIAIWDTIVGVARAIWQPIANFFSGLWEGIKTAFQAAWDAISGALRNAWNAIASFFKGMGRGILDALGDVGSILLNAGKSIIEGFLNGLKSAFDAVKNFVGGIANWISSHKGPIQADRTLLTPHGQVIMQGLVAGMASQLPALTSFLAGVSDQIATGIGTPAVGAGLGGNNPTPAAGLTAGAATVQINAYQTPGQDVLQFAHAVSTIGAQSIANAASTIAVTQQPVQIGATNKVVPVGAS